MFKICKGKFHVLLHTTAIALFAGSVQMRDALQLSFQWCGQPFMFFHNMAACTGDIDVGAFTCLYWATHQDLVPFINHKQMVDELCMLLGA